MIPVPCVVSPVPIQVHLLDLWVRVGNTSSMRCISVPIQVHLLDLWVRVGDSSSMCCVSMLRFMGDISA